MVHNADYQAIVCAYVLVTVNINRQFKLRLSDIEFDLKHTEQVSDELVEASVVLVVMIERSSSRLVLVALD